MMPTSHRSKLSYYECLLSYQSAVTQTRFHFPMSFVHLFNKAQRCVAMILLGDSKYNHTSKQYTQSKLIKGDISYI